MGGGKAKEQVASLCEDTNAACATSSEPLGIGAGVAVEELTQEFVARSKDVASRLAQSARETMTEAHAETDQAIASAGKQVAAWGSSLREHAPAEGVLGSAAQSVAQKLETGGKYMQKHGVGDMGDDVVDLIRRHPFPAIFVGLGLGCLIGMTFAKRR
jgi:ElaB/YqjD/DUF883 family membrane-anchored ribosome-binding protein